MVYGNKLELYHILSAVISLIFSVVMEVFVDFPNIRAECCDTTGYKALVCQARASAPIIFH